MMKWKFIVSIVWLLVSFMLITLLSTQDKEWLIDGGEIRNICDLMKSVENDDVRIVAMVITLPLFFPYLYILTTKKKKGCFQYMSMASIVLFWLWRFILRYQFCW